MFDMYLFNIFLCTTSKLNWAKQTLFFQFQNLFVWLPDEICIGMIGQISSSSSSSSPLMFAPGLHLSVENARRKPPCPVSHNIEKITNSILIKHYLIKFGSFFNLLTRPGCWICTTALFLCIYEKMISSVFTKKNLSFSTFSQCLISQTVCVYYRSFFPFFFFLRFGPFFIQPFQAEMKKKDAFWIELPRETFTENTDRVTSWYCHCLISHSRCKFF